MMEKLKVKYFNTMERWGEQLDALEEKAILKSKPISVVHTPRFIGQTNNQVLFFVDEEIKRD